MEFLVALPLLLLVVSNSLLLPSLGLAVSGQEAHEVAVARHHEQPPSPAAVRVSVAHVDLPMVASSVLGAESWLRAHVLAHYPSNHVTVIAVACAGGSRRHGQDLLLSRAAKNLHHALVRWGLVDEIKIDDASSAPCAKEEGGGALKRRLYGMHHLPPPSQPSMASPPPPGVPLSFAPNAPPEVVPSVPPAAAPPSTPIVVPAPATSPPVSMPATPPEAAAGGMAPSVMPAPCSAPPMVAMSPQPWSGEGGNGGGLWCVAKPTVPLDRLQEAMDYACSQDGVDCHEISAGGSCFYPDSISAHASYAFNSYWQKMKHIGGSCSFGGAAVLINSDPSMASLTYVLDE
uniref:X8 domain-containing protein n=1 Tax=Oryza punctata TaxID=4537 RepID=A0A0E0M6R5_ORYPU